VAVEAESMEVMAIKGIKEGNDLCAQKIILSSSLLSSLLLHPLPPSPSPFLFSEELPIKKEHIKLYGLLIYAAFGQYLLCARYFKT
jgi:hypothetical protein